MVYGPWVDEWARAGLSGTQMTVMLKLCSRLEFDEHGNAHAWYPLEEMAEETGKKPRTLSKAVSSLKEHGFLKQKSKAYNNHVAEYYVMPGRTWPAGKVRTGVAPKEPEGMKKQALKVRTGVAPLISKGLPPSYGQAVPPC